MSIIGTSFTKASGTILVLVLAASNCSAETIGQRRCMMLNGQLSAITQTATAPVPGTVGDLAERAHQLCLIGKTAQGLRAYAKALKIMGSHPIFPPEQQANDTNLRTRS
jgi:hypothetical protein